MDYRPLFCIPYFDFFAKVTYFVNYFVKLESQKQNRNFRNQIFTGYNMEMVKFFNFMPILEKIQISI